jgi:hypothetical protein
MQKYKSILKKNLSKTKLVVIAIVCLCEFFSTPFFSSAQSTLTISNYQLVGSQRVTLYEYDYTYSAKVTNTGPAVTNVRGALTSLSLHTIVIDGNLSFGDVAVGEVKDSSDTFIVRVDRRYPFSYSDLSWTISTNLPDLTAGSVSPITVNVNQPTSFTSVISNIGIASTGGTFFNFFQVATAADGGGTISDVSEEIVTPTLAAGATRIITSIYPYTFSSPGTYSLRACADKLNRNNLGIITESNEDNNCGAWTNITVNAPPSAVNIKVNGSDGPVDIDYNGTADITWISTNAVSCIVNPPNWSELNANSGTHILNLTNSITYTLSCLPSGPNSVDSVLVNIPFKPTDLNIIKTGQGTITSVPIGINCGQGCQSQTVRFPSDTTITVRVSTVAGRIFTGWSGDCSGKGDCIIKMDSAKTIIANFAVKPKYIDF